jgi:hypothetical protein
MLFAQSEDSDGDNGVLLTDTHTLNTVCHLTFGTQGRTVVSNNYQLPRPTSLHSARTLSPTHTAQKQW